MTNSSDKRVPSFIQFTDENSNRRIPKRRSTRLQKEAQQSNKKRKKDTAQSSTSTRQHRIARKGKETNHQQISPINDQDAVTKRHTCDTTNSSNHNTLPISNNEPSDEEPVKENDSSGLGSMQQTSPCKETDNNVVHHVLSLDHDINDTVAEETDASPQQQMSDISNHDMNSAEQPQQILSESLGHQEPLFDSFSMPVKRMPSISTTPAYTEHLEFNTITLSPDHGRKKVVPLSSLPVTTATISTTISGLDYPQKLADTATQRPMPSQPSSNNATNNATFQEPPPIVDDIINTSPPPVWSPLSAQRQLLSSPSLWPATDSSDSLTLPEPCEFYTPSTHLKDDTGCQQTDDNADNRITQDDTTFGWAVSMHIKGFFDRIKAALQ